VSGTFQPPTGPGSVVTLDGREIAGSVALGPGTHRVTVTGAEIPGPLQPSLQ
jgi:hypothetical protein